MWARHVLWLALDTTVSITHIADSQHWLVLLPCSLGDLCRLQPPVHQIACAKVLLLYIINSWFKVQSEYVNQSLGPISCILAVREPGRVSATTAVLSHTPRKHSETEICLQVYWGMVPGTAVGQWGRQGVDKKVQLQSRCHRVFNHSQGNLGVGMFL